MKKIGLQISIIILLSILPNVSFGQGCSDAGFCTLESFKPNQIDSTTEMSNQFKIGLFHGEADNKITVYGSYIEFNMRLRSGISIDVKITSIGQKGNDISKFGLSDLYLNTNYNLTQKTRLTAGVKFPLMNGNRKNDNLSLPMDYQSSLGTIDFIVGIGYQIDNIQLIAAYQQPLKQNSNEFITEDYQVGSKIRSFQSTNDFKRSGDVMLRASLPVTVSNKLKLTPSILPIYHIKNDKYTDMTGIEREIQDSQGLTLNGTIYFDYYVNSTSSIQLNMGMPIVVRDERPDGLTRNYIINVEYRVRL